MQFLNDWEEGVRNRAGFSIGEKEKMLLSKETRTGLRITGYCLL